MPTGTLKRKIFFAAITSASILSLIEAGSAIAERTVLFPTLPSPAPGLEPPDAPPPPDPTQLARWGGRLDAPPPAPDDLAPPGAHIILHEDPTKGWRLPANRTGESMGIQYRISALGTRGAAPRQKAPSEARLLTIGDSSIYGDTVDEQDVFSEIAATRLSERWGCTVSGVNGGVPGYTSAQALIWMQELWDKARPDIVVMGTMWSDIYPEGGRPQAHPLRQPLRRMATYRVLRLLLAHRLSAQKVRWIDGQDDIVADDADAAVPLAAYIGNLRQAAAFAQERGAEMVFLALPAMVDLDRVPVPAVIQEYRAAMAMVAAETGSPLVDGPGWLDREGGTLALFNDNVHPSAAGHALIGYAVAQALSEPPAPCR